MGGKYGGVYMGELGRRIPLKCERSRVRGGREEEDVSAVEVLMLSAACGWEFEALRGWELEDAQRLFPPSEREGAPKRLTL